MGHFQDADGAQTCPGMSILIAKTPKIAYTAHWQLTTIEIYVNLSPDEVIREF